MILCHLEITYNRICFPLYIELFLYKIFTLTKFFYIHSFCCKILLHFLDVILHKLVEVERGCRISIWVKDSFSLNYLKKHLFDQRKKSHL